MCQAKTQSDGRIDDLQSELDALQEELDDLQQYSRRTCLLFHGIKEEEEKNVEESVRKVIKDNVQAKLDEKNIGRCHRLGRKVGDKPRPVIVRFLSYRQRKLVFDKKRNMKGTRMGITENLTKKRYQRCVQEFGKGNCWTLDGRIFAKTDDEKKVFTMMSELDLFFAAE